MTDQRFVYRLMSTEAWQQAKSDGRLPWAPVDDEDGFFHLSGKDQVCETARLYYRDTEGLVALEMAEDALGDRLKWEASRGGALFPHYYGHLDADQVGAVYEMTWKGEAFEFGARQ
ncbi:MAG: DUF952 domain-containing protein [Pseudomonadota bacterium]